MRRFLFCHAGVKLGSPLRRQREEDLLWIKDEFLRSEQNFGKYVVDGYTPSSTRYPAESYQHQYWSLCIGNSNFADYLGRSDVCDLNSA